MKAIKIGICANSLGLSLRRALLQVQKLGVSGIELDAAGELAPRNLSDTGRRELVHLLRTHNLELSALGCPLRHGLDALENQEARIDHVRQVMQLSFDLGPRRVLLHAGQFVEDEKDPRHTRLAEGLLALGRQGDRTGVTLALETGPLKPELLDQFLNRFDCGSLAVNYDPAGLLMNGHDPLESARLLSRRIVHVRARDARTPLSGRTAQEVPLGHGDLDWLAVLAALEEFAYRGWVVVERQGGSDPAGDLAQGVRFLRSITEGI
jgi:sugar phosphate isomerase/epimerase